MKQFLWILFLPLYVSAQPYTSYRTGNANDFQTQPNGGICLMGGASEDDNAMTWFLQQANGGDVLVLRTSGSDGYNNYLYSSLGVTVNSVETIVCNNASASQEAYVQQRIQEAEAIWFAGGDQWEYISYWRDTPVDSLINDAIQNRSIVIGGTSAGMAIQGGYYFSAQNGTVTSATALSNPFDTNVTADSTTFIEHSILSKVITDTHYDNPDRKGRHTVFLARILDDYGAMAYGIACDEYTAVCIGTDGIAHVYGDFPTYDDNAYFLQVNCELSDPPPESLSPGAPLNWNKGNAALKVYTVKGTTSGTNTFDLTDWKTGTGGTWEHWWVDNGTLNSGSGTIPACPTFGLADPSEANDLVFPNPAAERICFQGAFQNEAVRIYSMDGKLIRSSKIDQGSVDIYDLPSGAYLIQWNNHKELIIKQ